MSIAFFDFDGTITTKDTLLEFIRFSKGKGRFYLGFALSSPWILAYKLKIISNQRAKERVLSFFFRKHSLSDFQQQCERFSSEALPGLIRPKALQEMQQLKDKGVEIVIVSASPENWIKTWATQMGASLIATGLQTTGETPRLTGKIIGTNCHGDEKVRRILASYSLADYREIYAYGDSSGDRPMLRLATLSFYKPFR